MIRAGDSIENPVTGERIVFRQTSRRVFTAPVGFPVGSLPVDLAAARFDDNQTIGLASDTVNVIPVGKLEAIGDDGLGYVSIGLDSGTVASSLSGSSAGVVANANTIGGIPVVHVFEIADAATADYDIVLADKTEFYDFVFIKTGGAGVAVTCTMKNTATAITDAVDLADADKVISRPATIDDASNVINAGGILRASIVRTTSGAGVKIIALGFKRA